MNEDLLQFLKKYSDVDIDFIRKFIEIRKGDKLHAPFSIDLDIVAEWLKTRKRKLKETLVSTYTENIDYICLTPPNGQQDKHGGHNKQLVLMTSDTFKMLTMKSKTKDAQKVRYYYVTLEKLVEIYQEEIIENQNKRIEELERNLKKIEYPVKGAVYVLKITDNDNEFRIGKTQNMNKRIKNYKTSHKDDPEVVYIFYTTDINRLEKCIKFALKEYEYRNRKEFYLASKDKILDAIEDCNHMITKYVNNDINMSRNKNKDFLFKTVVKYDVDQKGGCDNYLNGKYTNNNLRNKISYKLNRNDYQELVKFF